LLLTFEGAKFHKPILKNKILSVKF